MLTASILKAKRHRKPKCNQL